MKSITTLQESELKNSYIKQGDCLELMKEIPDKSVDMILCDLPYGTTGGNKWDKVIDNDVLAKEYNRIIKVGGRWCYSLNYRLPLI